MAAVIVALTVVSTLGHAAVGLPPIHKSLTLEFAVKDKARADFAADVKAGQPTKAVILRAAGTGESQS